MLNPNQLCSGSAPFSEFSDGEQIRMPGSDDFTSSWFSVNHAVLVILWNTVTTLNTRRYLCTNAGTQSMQAYNLRLQAPDTYKNITDGWNGINLLQD